jgi:hypothetical protein
MATIYLAMDDELLVVRGGDGRWETRTELEGRGPRCLSVDPRRPERVWCGTLGGAWRTDDAGHEWQTAGTALEETSLSAIAAGDGGLVFAGADPSALYRSEDGGDSWEDLPALLALPSAPTWSFPPRPDTSHVRWITLDPASDDRVYVCIEAGALVRSADGGRTWTDRVEGGPWDTHTLATHPAAPGRLYSAAGDGFMAPGRGYNESRDGGETWTQPDEGIERHYLYGMAVDPGDPDTILVSAANSPMAAHDYRAADATVYRRSGAGPWREVRDGLPDPAGSTRATLAASPAEPGVFYAAGNRGLFRSADAGATWEQLPVPWREAYVRQGSQALVVTP